jgi:hypothetical protein
VLASTITPTKSTQTAVAKNVYTTGAVTVAAIPNDYITTNDANATAAHMLSGDTAYVKGVKVTGTMPNNGALSKTMDGLNTKSITIPSGYTSGGAVSLDNTIDNEVAEQIDLITQIKNVVDSLPEAGGESTEINLQTKTVTPTAVPQDITADVEYDGLEKVTVNAIPSAYVKPTFTEAATTYTPSTTDQTIAAGTYCSGVQTIKGDANLISANIISGKTIFGVAGTAEAGGGGGSGVETVTISYSSNRLEEPDIHYLDKNLQYTTQTVSFIEGTGTGAISVVKNSIIVTTMVRPTISGSLIGLGGGSGTYAYKVAGDVTLSWSMSGGGM